MTEWPKMGIQTARDKFRTVVDDALIRNTPTAIERHGEPVAAVIPYGLAQLVQQVGGVDRAAEILRAHLNPEPTEGSQPNT
ncbi:hypothetical protein GCM10011608_09260 [Micromonospora sonchi]|uniref:Antitoxin n=1 Tax=Micromonospora sonchi TaxID=1763543 RepID=A0A917TKI1_9ACTN|nr:type II toxin-antitoxin system Phd/YefM family antitoxin [Micromonospora sonchi]GGM26601.1 hypothetical protein GCM10011608_09260 [Micromonospora sonchi]